MGADFGGVIALAPAVVLMIAVSGIRFTGPRVIVAVAPAVITVGLISFLDWARGPDRRSHLGNFVQRLVDLLKDGGISVWLTATAAITATTAWFFVDRGREPGRHIAGAPR